ncbi:MAG: hypothetical protein AAB295_10445 [Chloroflexota bacterium]
MAPLVCASLNLLAALVMAFVIAPATPLVPEIAERERYIREHLLPWRLAWLTWMAAGASLLWFYSWWRARVRGPKVALAIAAVGLVADWSAEIALIASGADGYRSVAPAAFFLTGAIANGLYTFAGIQLTLATPLGVRARAYAAFMWSAALMLSLGAAIAQPLVVAIATAELFALFCPWCVWLWLRLR